MSLIGGTRSRFRAAIGFALLLAIIAAASPVHTAGAFDGCIDYGTYLHWVGGIEGESGGASVAVAVTGSLACVLDGTRLYLIDVTQPAAPQEVSQIDLPGYPGGVAILGDFAYVASDSAGLVIVNVHDRAVPSITAALATGDHAYSVALSGSNAYVAGTGNVGGELHVIDVSNPSAPRSIGNLTTPGEDLFVAVAGTHAYVAAGEAGLRVIDISRPASPTLVGTVDTPGTAVGVAAVGDRAYVADQDKGLQIVDVSRPASPTIVNSMTLPGQANAVALSGTDVLVACGSPDLVDIDISEPAFPKIGGVTGTIGVAWGIAVSGHYAFLAAGDRRLQIVEIANPHTPDPIGTTALPTHVTDLTVVGNYVYQATGGPVVQIVNAQQMRNPGVIGSFAVPGNAMTITSAANRLFIGVENKGIVVADVTTPTAPTILGSTNGPPHPRAVAISGNTVLVAALDGGLHLIDVSNPSSPSDAAAVPTPSQAFGVAVAGDRYACVTDFIAGLIVVDFLNPHLPTIAGTYDTGVAIGVAASDSTAFVTDNSGMQVIDISTPTAPTFVGRLEIYDHNLKRIALAGPIAYLTGEDQGLQVIDVRKPALPRLIGSAILTRAGALQPTDGGIFVGSYDSRLWIMPPQCALTPVLLTDLSAEQAGDGVRIRWRSGGDILFDGFRIERATSQEEAADAWAPLNAEDPVPGRGPYEYIDRSAMPGQIYSYRVVGLISGAEGIVYGPVRIAFTGRTALALLPPSPNPARGAGASLRFDLPRDGDVRLRICDAGGRRVRALAYDAMRAGRHGIVWDGRDDAGRRVASGIYWIRLTSGGTSTAARLAVIH